MSKIAVAGSTGRVGRHVVDVLEAQGHDVVRISRSTGVDVITAEGLAEALHGVECIVDAASWPSSEQEPATEFFIRSAANLQAYGERAGVRRIVVVSIIGADRFSAGYIASKIPHEQAHLTGPIPVRVLRAAQFHEFVELLMAVEPPGRRDPRAEDADPARGRPHGRLRRSPSSPPTPSRSSPVYDAPIWEIAGPRAEDLVEIARLVAARRGDPVRIEGVSRPRRPGPRPVRVRRSAPGPGRHARGADVRGVARVAGAGLTCHRRATPAGVCRACPRGAVAGCKNQNTRRRAAARIPDGI